MLNQKVLYTLGQAKSARGTLIGFTERKIGTLGIVVNEGGDVITVPIEHIQVVR